MDSVINDEIKEEEGPRTVSDQQEEIVNQFVNDVLHDD